MSAIKLSAPDWCFFRNHPDAEAYYRQLAQLGITGVEMLEPARWPLARKAGLEILNLGAAGMQKGLNRIEHHAELLPQIRASIAQAAAAKIPQVIVFSGNRAGQDDAEGRRNVVTGLKQLAPDAARAGVTLVFEMLCAQNHADYQADRSAYGFAVVRAVDSPAVKVLYDIYHMSRMGEDVCRDIAQNRDIIAHLHTAESPQRSAPLRSGEINYAKIIEAVRKTGYDGYWGLEFIPQGEVMAELKAAVAVFS